MTICNWQIRMRLVSLRYLTLIAQDEFIKTIHAGYVLAKETLDEYPTLITR